MFEDGEEEEPVIEKKRVSIDKMPLEILKEDLIRWLSQVPVIAFNGCKYDLNVVREYLYPKLISEYGAREVSLLKRGCSYLSVSTPQFKFLDMRNFVPPSFSLDKFLKSFKAPAQKGVFMYEAVTCAADLRQTHCPPKSAFRSEFRNTDITDEDYRSKVQHVWEEKGMQTWKDFLIHYNSLDVEPFLKAVNNYEAWFQNCDLFKSFISLSSAAYYIGFTKTQCKFFKCPKEIFKLMKENIVGGFSSCTTRHFKAGESKLRTGDGKIAGKVHGFDCNAMYLSCTQGDMPTGPPRKYELRANGKLYEECVPGTSLVSKGWLDHLKKTGHPNIQTAFNTGNTA